MNLIELTRSIEEQKQIVSNFFDKIQDAVTRLAEMVPNGVSSSAVASEPTRKGRKRRKSNMSAAARAAVSARMKKYWADKRKAKGAKKAKAKK